MCTNGHTLYLDVYDPHIGQRSRSYKGQSHTKVKNIHMLSQGDTPIRPNLVSLNVKEQRGSYQSQIHDENFDIEVKGQGHTEIINVCDTLYHGDKLTCYIKNDFVKGQKSCGPNTKPCHKPYKYDLEVKGQHCIGIMNVSNISSHDESPLCQIW